MLDGEAELAADATLAASRALVAVTARSLAGALEQVTLQQYRVLVVLWSRGPQPSGALARNVGVHSSTFTRLADRLVKGGWVVRTQSADNRREVVIALTPAGRKLVSGSLKARRKEISTILARVSPTKRKQICAALEAFAEAAGELGSQPLDVPWVFE